jgi:hypothetical protein
MEGFIIDNVRIAGSVASTTFLVEVKLTEGANLNFPGVVAAVVTVGTEVEVGIAVTFAVAFAVTLSNAAAFGIEIIKIKHIVNNILS